jgi:hypothetical protein
MTKRPIVIETPPIGLDRPRANFINTEFDINIWEHGYNVIHELGLQCPCKSKNTNQQSNCKNCGGSGWIFLNPTKTRMVLHSMNLNTKYQMWSQENAGTVSISCRSNETLGFMDRLTVLDGLAIFWEVLFLKEIFDGDESLSSSESKSTSKSESVSNSWSFSGSHSKAMDCSISNSESASLSKSSSMSCSHHKGHHKRHKDLFYFNTLYPIKSIIWIALFNGTQNKLIHLQYGPDFYYKDNKIVFSQPTNILHRDLIQAISLLL